MESPHRLGRRVAQHSHAHDLGDLQVDTACLAASTQQYCPTPCSARRCNATQTMLAKLKLLNIFRCTPICFVVLAPASNPVVPYGRRHLSVT